MNIFHQQNRWKEIPHYGEIGAGVVVPFPKESEKKTVKIPVHSNKSCVDDEFSHTVNGDSLNDFENPDKNIRHGDLLICKKNIELSDVTPEKICIVFISQTCEKLAKKVIFNGERVILRSSNPHYKDRDFAAEVVEIKGIVTSFKRNWDW